MVIVSVRVTIRKLFPDNNRNSGLTSFYSLIILVIIHDVSFNDTFNLVLIFEYAHRDFLTQKEGSYIKAIFVCMSICGIIASKWMANLIGMDFRDLQHVSQSMLKCDLFEIYLELFREGKHCD